MNRLIFSFVFVIFLVGCSDPYAERLPVSGRISESDAEKIANGLKSGDKELFLQWSRRVSAGNLMVGEITPPNVASAIKNQQTYLKEAEEKALKKMQEELALERQKIKAAYDAEILNITDRELKRVISVASLSYKFEPVPDRSGRVLGYGWNFSFNFKNAARQSIVGIAGVVDVADVFGQHLGVYPFRLEYMIPPGSNMVYSAVLDFDRKNPFHVKMREADRLIIRWYFEKLVFSDGVVMDKELLDKNGFFDKVKMNPKYKISS